MTRHNHKTGLLVPGRHNHYSLQFVAMCTPSAKYGYFGEVKVISCFRNRISPIFIWPVGENSIELWPLSSFFTHNDVKTPSVAVVITKRMFHQSCCQTGKQWQVAHISPAQAKWASKWDKAARQKWHIQRWQLFSPGNNGFDRCPACFTAADWDRDPKKKCVIKYTISSWCKKTRGFRRPRHISNLPFTRKCDGSTQHARRALCFDTSRIQLLDPKAPLVHTRTLSENGH